MLKGASSAPFLLLGWLRRSRSPDDYFLPAPFLSAGFLSSFFMPFS